MDLPYNTVLMKLVDALWSKAFNTFTCNTPGTLTNLLTVVGSGKTKYGRKHKTQITSSATGPRSKI